MAISCGMVDRDDRFEGGCGEVRTGGGRPEGCPGMAHPTMISTSAMQHQCDEPAPPLSTRPFLPPATFRLPAE